MGSTKSLLWLHETELLALQYTGINNNPITKD